MHCLVLPAPPAQGIPLHLCTPRGSSTSLVPSTSVAARPYSNDLPWLRFLEHDLGVFLRGVEAISGSQGPVRGAIADHETNQQLLELIQQPYLVVLPRSAKAKLFPVVFEQAVRTSLRIAIGSEEMALQLLARKSVDRLAAEFDWVMPEAYPDENLHRATVLASGAMADVQVELLKIILFLLSNNLILDSPEPWDREKQNAQVDQARQVITLCRLSGLAQLQTLRQLVALSRRSLTMTAVVESLFKAAVLCGAAGFVQNLLKADDRLRPAGRIKGLYASFDKWESRRLRRALETPLQYAIAKQFENLVTVLLDAGVDLPPCPFNPWSLLAVAIYERSPVSLTGLLMHRGAPLNGLGVESLQAAILTGDAHLMFRLVMQGADVNYRCRSFRSAENGFFPLFSFLDGIGCLGFAAAFRSVQPAGMYRGSLRVNDQDPFHANHDKALDLCREILTRYDLQLDLSDERMTADAIIIASAQGYTKVIAFLYEELSVNVNIVSGSLSPLYVAVAYRQVEAVRLLLQLGASPCPPTDSIPTYVHHEGISLTRFPTPSLLQLAVDSGSCEIAELLIERGACIDEVRQICICRNRIAWPPGDQSSPLRAYSHEFNTRLRVSPFQLAMLLGQWDVGFILARQGAAITSDYLFAAAGAGHLPLVKQLLARGIHITEATRDGTTAFQAVLYSGHGLVARHLVSLGGDNAGTRFAVAFRIPDVASIRALVPPEFLAQPRNLHRDLEGRTYLENAVLSGCENVTLMALDLDGTAYDSGALCAEVLRLTESEETTASPILKELLRRRGLNLDSSHIKPALENHALSIAAYHSSPDIIDALLSCMPPSNLAQPLAVIAPRVEDDLDHEWGDLPLLFDADDVYGRICNRRCGDNTWHASTYWKVSPLLFAVQGQSPEEHAEMLLDAGYRPDCFALRTAIYRQLSLGLLKRMIESCCDIDATAAVDLKWVPEYEITPLCVAVGLGRVDIVETLLAHHADVNIACGSRNETALGVAVKSRNLFLIHLLLDAGAEINIPLPSTFPRGGFRASALQVAAADGHIGVVRLLIARGADINARRSGDGTALEEAAFKGRLDTVQLLLDSGAGTEGHCRFQYVYAIVRATKAAHGAVVELLRSHREWSEADARIWDQFQNSAFREWYGQILPFELPLAALVEELTKMSVEDSASHRVNRCVVGWPRAQDKMVATLVKSRVAEASRRCHFSAEDAVKEAAQAAIGAIRMWSDESDIPLPCWNIWGAESGQESRSVKACNKCGERVWYYLPCHLDSDSARTEELRWVVTEALQSWSPSWLQERSSNSTPQNSALLPPIDAEGYQEAPAEFAAVGADEWEDMNLDAGEIEVEEWRDLETGDDQDKTLGHDQGRDGWDARERAILADMRGEEEAPFSPMDCGW